MKFKFDLNQKNLIRIACIACIIVLLPFSFELAFLIDLGGIDFAITFLMMFLASNYNLLLARWEAFKQDLAGFLRFLAELYLFKPKVFVPHTVATGIIMSFTCSLFLACLFWIPAMYASSGFIS